MTIDTVNDLPPRVQYVASAAQTDFDYTFPIFADADLVVDVDGATQALATDYTVAGEGDDAGGTVTFLVAMAGGEIVTIYRSMAIERTTDFSQNGEFSSDTFNDELDRITLVLQDLRSQINRSLRLSQVDGVASASMELPIPASRAGKFLYFNGTTGAPEMATGAVAGTVLSASTIGAEMYDISDAESAAGLVVGDLTQRYRHGDVRRYGAVLDGVTSDSTAFNAASSQWAQEGGAEIVIPSGYTAMLSTQWTAARPTYRNCAIYAYGAEIKTSGAISALKITGGAPPHSCTVYGLNVNHRANADATAGIHLSGTSHVSLIDPVIEGDDNAATYAGILVENSTASDSATGCFWTRIIRPKVRQRSGADGAAPTYGVILRGAANAAVIRDGAFTAVTGVRVEHHSGQTYVANGVVIDGNSFEGCTTAISFNGDATSTFSGERITNNRGESLTNFLSLTGSTSQPAVPVWMSGNYMISSVTNYLVNTNNLYVNNFDFFITPDLSMATTLRSRDPLTLIPISGSGGHALGLWTSGAGLGIQCYDNSGTAKQTISWGTGAPTHSAEKGSFYMRTDGGAATCFYVNESGSTTWAAK